MAAKVTCKILKPIYLSQINTALPGVSCTLSEAAAPSWSRALTGSCKAYLPELHKGAAWPECAHWLGTRWALAEGSWAGTPGTEQIRVQHRHQMSDPPASFLFSEVLSYTVCTAENVRCLMNLSNLQAKPSIKLSLG